MGGFLGTILGTGTNKWIEGGMGTALADARNYGTLLGTGQWPGLARSITNVAGYDLPYMGGALMGSAYGPQSIGNQLGSYMQNLPSMQSAFGRYTTPQMDYSQQGMSNVVGTLGGLMGNTLPQQGLAQQVFAGGGWTPQYQQGFNQLSNFLGQGTPGLQTSPGMANNLIGSAGANPFNQQLQNYALQAAGAGGMTPTLGMLLNPMQGIINTGGQTPTSAGLTDQGLNLFGQQALMNPAQASSLAREQAATNMAQQAQHAEQQALARGGGPGSVVASGQQNQGMADFANQMQQAQSQAATTALQNQQQLQLQQQLGGGNIAQNAGQMANALLMGGMGMAPTTQNAATNYLNAYLGGGLGAGQNQLGFLGQGQNLANMLQTGQLGGINAMTGMMGAQNQYALGAGNLANALSQTQAGMAGQQGNILNNLVQSQLGQGQLGNAMFGNYLQGMGQGFGAQNAFMGNLNNAYSNMINPLLGLAGQQNQLATAGLGAEAGIFGGMGGALSSGAQLGQGAFSGLLGAGLGMIP